ncbi:MAG UNVERIFIED_CONTAM: hypothetical protein LVT10_22760 [Anaerolineae bacterium]
MCAAMVSASHAGVMLLQVCGEDAQYTFALTFRWARVRYCRSSADSSNVGMTESPCVFCGQCLDVLPNGGTQAKD